MTQDGTWSRLRARINRAQKKAEATTTQNGMRACRNIESLVALRDAIEREIDREMITAHDQGATLAMIPYGSSRQSTQQRLAKARDRGNGR